MAAATPSEFECTDYMTETDYLNGRLVYKTDKRSFDTVRECKQWAAAKCEAAVAKIRN